MRSNARNATAYFAELSAERREPLMQLRKLILATWPTMTEDMDRDMPTYNMKGHPLFALSSQKHFMALYVMPHDLLHAFKKDLLIYDRGLSCIRFKRLEPSTVDLFDRIIKYVGNQWRESELIETREKRRTILAK